MKTEPAIPLAMPYAFDTTMAHRWVLIGFLSAIPIFAVIYVLMWLSAEHLKSDDLVLIGLALAVVAVVDIFMGWLLYRQGQGAKGSISPHMIQITADRFLGLTSAAPEGTFTPQQFENVALLRTNVKGAALGLVTLTGKDPAHTIKIAHLPRDQAEKLAILLSKELKLPRIDK